MNADATWHWLTTSPLVFLTITIGLYVVAERVHERFGRHPLLNPMVVSALVVGGLIAATGIDYDTYLQGTSVLTFLLGPATVALGLPLYHHAGRVLESGPMVLAAVVFGSVFSILSGYWLTRLLGGDEMLAASMAPKSATTPIAMALAEGIGGVVPIAVLFVMVAGILGALFGPQILTLVGVTDPRARGLAMGVGSHGVGTARALQEGAVPGAFSGLAMGLTGLVISLVIPLLVP